MHFVTNTHYIFFTEKNTTNDKSREIVKYIVKIFIEK